MHGDEERGVGIFLGDEPHGTIAHRQISARSISSKAEYLPTSSTENALGFPCRVICGDASRAAQPSSCCAIPFRTLARGSGGRKRSLPQRSAKAPSRRA